MLSSSHRKIHEPSVTGVSPRPMDQRQRQETAKHEGPWANARPWPRSGWFGWPEEGPSLHAVIAEVEDHARPAAISVTRTSSPRDSSITVPKMMFACG